MNSLSIFKNLFSYGKKNRKLNQKKETFAQKLKGKDLALSVPQIDQRRTEIKEFPTSPVSKKGYNLYAAELVFPSGIYDGSFRIKLYRFLKDNIPVLNSAIWTWTRICSSPNYFQLKGSDDQKILDWGNKIIRDLDRRIFQHSFQKFGGIELLLSQFFGSLFTDGAVCGEVTLTPTKDKIDKFYFIDPTTVRFKLKDETIWELYQEVEGRFIKLNPHSTFYYGLDVDSSDPRGKSILSSIPFVARIEQRLLEDMNKTMHNAGYHRIHIKIKPPERLSSESDDAYIQRANRYFEDTIEMMKKISLEDNPITWNDVEINYIGPSGQYASATSWYINHKSLIEDICAGVHLDPFMLGYSYGPSYNWAQIKYELILRNVVSIQSSAKRFLEWIRNLELALQGIPLECVCYFDNRKTFGLLEKYQAEKIFLENVVKKMEAGFISKEEGKREMEQTGQ